MSASNDRPPPTRRGFLTGLSGIAAVAASVPAIARASDAPAEPMAAPKGAVSEVVPFWGRSQAGIITPAQTNTYMAALDITTTKRADLIRLMRAWTEASAKLTVGEPVAIPAEGEVEAQPDPNDLEGLSPSRLTITFGFGPGLFGKDGNDRFGLGRHRPEAFVDLPHFPGDQMIPARTGGDLLIQACADNAQVAFHAVRQLTRLAYGLADIRWVQSGFGSDYGPGKTPRNLMGFKDGTGNPDTSDASLMDKHVWVGSEAPDWMQGGSYVVIRRARIALEHWDRTKVAFQEQTFGRQKKSGAPLGSAHEFDKLDLTAQDTDGNPVIPENSHVRLAHQAALDGNVILRRSYSYNDGANVIAERWPPWRQGMEFDAGLIFVGYQRDIRTSFIPIFEKMSRFDMMNQFVTNVGGGHFACPRGVEAGEYLGQRLFETA
jgi:deferrochelatase/peroxidase EfeB